MLLGKWFSCCWEELRGCWLGLVLGAGHVLVADAHRAGCVGFLIGTKVGESMADPFGGLTLRGLVVYGKSGIKGSKD